MCDLAVFVNRHTLPSRTVTEDRHRKRATLSAYRFRASTRAVCNAMEVEPMCIAENETVSARFFGDTRLTMCSRVTQICHGETTGLASALGGITPHCAKRARAGRSGSRFARSTIALARANRNCPDTPACIDCDRGRRGGRAGEGLPFSWPIFRSCGQAGA